jgi:hypothetical protein
MPRLVFSPAAQFETNVLSVLSFLGLLVLLLGVLLAASVSPSRASPPLCLHM